MYGHIARRLTPSGSVKGRVFDATDVTVTTNETDTALNKPDLFVLSVVRVNDGNPRRPQCVRNPFSSDWGRHHCHGAIQPVVMVAPVCDRAMKMCRPATRQASPNECVVGAFQVVDAEP